VFAVAGSIVLGAVALSGAAEFRLRDRCDVAGTLVTLADVAEVFAPDPQQIGQLGGIELFPAPPPGQRRFVRQREIEDLLALRGVNLAGHRFSGAAQVEIARDGRTPQGPVEPRASASTTHRAERLIRDAIVQHLQRHVAKDEPWSVQVQTRLDDRQAQAVSTAGERISARGGHPPWTGGQRFELELATTEGTATLAVEAQVTLPPAVVVALRSIPKGSVIQVTDVQLQRGIHVESQEDACYTLEEVLGSETTQVIPAGKAIEKGYIRSPILVRRGQAVTVCARSSGIRVRTTARAKDDGSQGDLIAVESLLDRKAYYARVCGIQEAEVYARAVQSGRDVADRDHAITAERESQ
jgi:flagella basal body P-ring formation protein FlgA